MRELTEIIEYGNGNYYADEGGIIWSKRMGYLKKVWGTITSSGHISIVLTDNDGIRRTFKAHRLIANCFVPNPEDKPFVHHKNEIPSDNRVINLQRVTYREHLIIHFGELGSIRYEKTKEGNYVKGSAKKNAKLTEEDVMTIRKRILTEKYRDVHKDYQIVSWWLFRDICRGKRWKHVVLSNDYLLQ